VILRGATLIDGTGAPPVRDRAVVVDDRRIAAIAADRPSRDEAVLDLGGLTLLPGLINCHVHLCLSGEADPARTLADETYAATVVSAVVRARRTVEAGVTTVRDLGGREYAEIAVRDGVRAGAIAGPRILCAGRAVCMTGGHGWRLLGRQADGADDLRRAVREQLRAGADVIKLVATGGVMTPGVDPRAAQLTLEELRAGVDEAHRARRRAAAHAMADEGIAWCLDAGIDTIEHGVFLTEALAARMARQGTALVATLVAPHAIVEGGLDAGIPAFAVTKSVALRERHLESFRLALRAGVVIAAGTDAGTPLNPHGTIVPELALMVAAGMEPLQALRAATSDAARALGLEAETGSVAPGLVADLIAVEGDPATDVKALDAIRLVIADGRTVLSRL
jgi:imidazolonepropionase-like amidohydrolase